MVVNYKYYEMDLRTLYVNKSYASKSQSDKADLGEGIMKNVVYDEYSEVSSSTTRRTEELASESPGVQIIFMREPSKWNRFCRFCRNVFSFKSCRRS